MNKNKEAFQPELQVKKVSLENFRGFEKFELVLQPDLTVLIGKNGSGKTAILEGIAKLLTVFVNEIRGEEQVNRKDLKTVFDAWNIRKGATQSISTLTLFFDHHEFCWEINFHKKACAVLKPTTTQNLNALIQPSYQQEKINLPIIVYYPTSQAPINTIDFKNAGEDFETDVFTVYEQALDGNTFDFITFFLWYRWQENIEKQLGENSVIKVVRDAIYKLLGFDNHYYDKLSINWLNNPTGEMIIYKNQIALNINQLSSGEKTLLALVADLARRLAIANPHRENPLFGYGVVLIDEVDLHLHPGWQRTIIPQLQKTFPNCQFIITTHSPLVLSQISRQNVVILEDFKPITKIPHTFGRDINSLLYFLTLQALI